MKKSLIILPITIVALVVAYLIYDLVKPSLTSPCESIFQQTSLNLKTHLAIIKSKGEVFIGRQKIQELTEQAQIAALTLKTCCILSENGILSAEEFLRCKGGAAQYQKQMAAITRFVDEAQQAKQQSERETLDQKLRQLNAAVQSFQKTSRQMKEYLLQQQSKRLTGRPDTQTGAGKKIEGGAKSAEPPGTGRINLIAAKNGGQVLVGTSNDWINTIDGNESQTSIWVDNDRPFPEAVFGFENERPAVFDLFTVLITETRGANLAEFELLIGENSPTGSFRSLGTFRTQNIKLFKTPYQEFRFPAVTTKYLKVRLLSRHDKRPTHHWLHEIQLWGTLK